MSVALVAIAKNEKLYVQDWIQYYRKLGVCAIYLQDNSSTDDNNLKCFALDEPGFRVHVEPWTDSSQCKQPNAQNHFLRTQAKLYTHAAVMDLDEIIVLKRHKTIVEFVADHCKEGAVGLNWYLFGDSGHATQNSEPFYQRFTKRQRDVNPHVKCIARICDVRSFDIHKPHLLRGYYHDTLGKRISALGGSHNPNGPVDVAVVHHYFTKSLEEFQQKRSRGRATTHLKRSMEEFHSHNRNEVEDTSAWDFFTAQ